MTNMKTLMSLLVAGLFFSAACTHRSPHGEDHSAHMAMMKKKNSYSQSQVEYQVPDVVLLNQEGEKVNLKEFLANSEPYALNFIFTTCSTICPILTASFSQMQRKLGDGVDSFQFISFTIDPEYDTPAVLKAYADKVGANKNWTFLTGDYETIATVEKAFDAFAPDKMDHRPIYFIKTASGQDWIRIDGLASGSDLAEIYEINALF